MNLSELIFDKFNTENIFRMPLEDMRQIIKNEAKIAKFITRKTQNSRRIKIE